MRLVPEDNVGRIEFYETHLSRWAERAAEIGTTEADVAELQGLADEARSAMIAQHRAQSTAQSATLRVNMAIEALARKGSNVVQQIRAKAATDGNAVYSLAI